MLVLVFAKRVAGERPQRIQGCCATASTYTKFMILLAADFESLKSAAVSLCSSHPGLPILDSPKLFAEEPVLLLSSLQARIRSETTHQAGAEC